MTVRDLAWLWVGTVARVEDPRAHVRAAALVEQRISDGTYAPGSRIHIGLLAEETGIYRAAIGRALAMLQGRGLVVRYPGSGWYVA